MQGRTRPPRETGALKPFSGRAPSPGGRFAVAGWSDPLWRSALASSSLLLAIPTTPPPNSVPHDADSVPHWRPPCSPRPRILPSNSRRTSLDANLLIMQATSVSQWLFPVSAVLDCTPSRTTSSISVEKELYDRARGVEFLYRLGVTLGLYVPQCCPSTPHCDLHVRRTGPLLHCTPPRHGSTASTCAIPWKTIIDRYAPEPPPAIWRPVIHQPRMSQQRVSSSQRRLRSAVESCGM